MKSLLWNIDIATGLTQNDSFSRYERIIKKHLSQSVLQKINADNGNFLLDCSETEDELTIFLTGTEVFEELLSLKKDEIHYRLTQDSFGIGNFEQAIRLAVVLLSMVSGDHKLEDVLSESFQNKIELYQKKRQERFYSNQKLNLNNFDEWDWLHTECECCGSGSEVAYKGLDGQHILCANCERSIKTEYGLNAMQEIIRNKA